MKPECEYPDINFLARAQPGEVFYCSYPGCTAAFSYRGGHEGLQQVEGVKRCDEVNATIAELRRILYSADIFIINPEERDKLRFHLWNLENEANDMGVEVY